MEKLKKILKMISYGVALYFLFSPVQVQAADVVSAEYKCTSKCNLCLTYSKKTVCSESFVEDSAEYMKAKKLSRFINDGLITPDEKIKPGFGLEQFGHKYFNCDLMIKKAEQIREATQNMCSSSGSTKTAKSSSSSSKKMPKMPRMPASRSSSADEEQSESEE
jgi:hypothetical protein